MASTGSQACGQLVGESSIAVLFVSDSNETSGLAPCVFYIFLAWLIWFLVSKSRKLKRTFLRLLERQDLTGMVPARDAIEAVEQLGDLLESPSLAVYFFEEDLSSFTKPGYGGPPPALVMHRLILRLRDVGLRFGVGVDKPVREDSAGVHFVREVWKNAAFGLKLALWMEGSNLCVRMQPFGMCGGRVELTDSHFYQTIRNNGRLLHNSIAQAIEETAAEIL